MSIKLLREFIRHALSATREPNSSERNSDTFANLGAEDQFPDHLKNIGIGPEHDDLGPVPPNDDDYFFVTADPYTRFTGI